jgi:NAD-dependent deacetylase
MKIVILTGAGISAESGLSTFRDKGGLWDDYPIEQIATPEGFARNPARVHRFYNERRSALKTVQPNAAHIALATLEARLKSKGGELMIVTQNVDDLHERGGSHHVLHMHGELTSIRCTACNARQRFTGETRVNMICEPCGGGVMRPDIVWFGEMPFFMPQIEAALAACDLFVSIGTSGAVYPAAGFVHLARELGKDTLEINLQPSEGSHIFAKSRLGKASTCVPQWVDEILEKI